MRKIVIATNNKSKKAELINVLGSSFDVKTLEESGIDHDTIEDRDTLVGNSEKKAVEIRNILLDRGVTDTIVIADDSGLFVRALDWSPGVLSARYAGDHNDQANMDKLLSELSGVSDRYAEYSTVLCVINEEGNITYASGITPVMIGHSPSGSNGFGYDPITYYQGKSLATMTLDEKDKISHRGIALRKVLNLLS